MPLEGTSTRADALSGILRSNVSLQRVVLADVEFCAITLDVQNASGIRGRKRMLCRLVKQLKLVTYQVDAFGMESICLLYITSHTSGVQQSMSSAGSEVMFVVWYYAPRSAIGC